MTVEYVPVAALREYGNNARIIPDAAVDYVAASIAEAGFINPIVVDAAAPRRATISITRCGKPPTNGIRATSTA